MHERIILGLVDPYDFSGARNICDGPLPRSNTEAPLLAEPQRTKGPCLKTAGGLPASDLPTISVKRETGRLIMCRTTSDPIELMSASR